MKTYEVLEKALALIDDEDCWWQGSYCDGARDRFCALGAINVAVGCDPAAEESEAKRFRVEFCRFAKETTGQFASAFNDLHTHAEVVELFQRAIRAEKEKVGVVADVPAEAPQEVPA